MKANYHTHTEYCGHAMGSASEYVKEAVRNGFEEIGISDHAPNANVKDYGVRMKPDKLLFYLKDIEDAKKAYKTKIKVLKGLEVEFFYDHEQYYEELKRHTDYLVHGQHYISLTKKMDNLKSGFALHTKEEIFVYSDYLVAAMESKHFDILAHPDLYMCGYRDFDRAAEKVAHIICKKAKETDTILEFNANGYRRGTNNTPQGILQPYPRLEFWEIVKSYGIRTILGSDCHDPEFLYDSVVKEAEEVYKKLGLKQVTLLDTK